MRKPITPTSGRTSLKFVSDRQNRCTFDDMAGWRYDDYAATYEPHAYIRYASSRGDINRVIARQIRAWDKQGLTGREISEAIEKCHAALERRAAI